MQWIFPVRKSVVADFNDIILVTIRLCHKTSIVENKKLLNALEKYEKAAQIRFLKFEDICLETFHFHL